MQLVWTVRTAIGEDNTYSNWCGLCLMQLVRTVRTAIAEDITYCNW